MKRKQITVVLLGIALVLTLMLIVGSFVNYAEPRPSSVEMQNIYIGRILKFGGWIAVIQLVTLALLLSEKRRS